MAFNGSFRTDLAIESADTGDKRLPDGVLCRERVKDGVKITTVGIKTEKAAKRLKRSVGTYCTLEAPFHLRREIISAASKVLSEMLPDGAVLVVGIGNRRVTADSLGPAVADGIFATGHLKECRKDAFAEGLRPVCALIPGASGQTGLESADIIAAALGIRKFSAVVAVDSLAALSPHRLGAAVQISDSGIAPGSGVGSARREVSEKTLGVPVLSVGIPTVSGLREPLSENKDEKDAPPDIMLTPRDIDRIIKSGTDILSMSLNLALQPSLTEEEIRFLTR